ncbi:hypothetical protein Pelo_5786 [Pelomyxa schiedti]|nr:hypothetical protein Pelo_5786 [Pelomyxa schiedti]
MMETLSGALQSLIEPRPHLVVLVDCSDSIPPADYAVVRDSVLPRLLSRTRGLTRGVLEFAGNGEAHPVCPLTTDDAQLADSVRPRAGPTERPDGRAFPGMMRRREGASNVSFAVSYASGYFSRAKQGACVVVTGSAAGYGPIVPLPFARVVFMGVGGGVTAEALWEKFPGAQCFHFRDGTALYEALRGLTPIVGASTTTGTGTGGGGAIATGNQLVQTPLTTTMTTINNSSTQEQLVQQLQSEKKALLDRLNRCEEQYRQLQQLIDTMISLIPADISDFSLERRLGTGAGGATFKVQFHRNCSSTSTSGQYASCPNSSRTTTMMVMKVVFNWENTPGQTMLRQKYMAECVILSSIPHHPNVVHPLGAIVLPRLPSEFIEAISKEKNIFQDTSLNRSLGFLMPFCGIPLSPFLSSVDTMHLTRVVVDILSQALKAIHHIESHMIVHKDIKQDNLLIDPETRKLTVIDFGEAQRCLNSNLDSMISTTAQPWANPGTIPPELSTILRNLTRTNTASMFSYAKCDSFALALTFYDSLLPEHSKFIGTPQNADMSQFTTDALLSSFPLPSSVLSTATSTLHPVLVGMMHPDKSKRLSADQALSVLIVVSATSSS